MITPGPLPRPRQLPRVPPVRGRDSARHHVSPRPRLERGHEHVRLGGQRRLRHQQVMIVIILSCALAVGFTFRNQFAHRLYGRHLLLSIQPRQDCIWCTGLLPKRDSIRTRTHSKALRIERIKSFVWAAAWAEA